MPPASSPRTSRRCLGLCVLLLWAALATPSPAAPQTPQAVSISVAHALIERRFADVTALFDPKLTAAVPEAKLSSEWKQTTEPMGPLVKVGTSVVQQFGRYTIATVPLVYERGPINLVLTQDGDKIVGIFLRPGDVSRPN